MPCDVVVCEFYILYQRRCKHWYAVKDTIVNFQNPYGF